jgi:hypothetical protein
LNDTYVSEQAPTKVNGGPTLRAEAGSGVHAHTYLRFVLPAIPGHCSIPATTLRLYATSSQGPGTIDVHRASATWSSSTATWNMGSRPASPAQATVYESLDSPTVANRPQLVLTWG